MILSDEDYGILYNAVAYGPNQLDRDTLVILSNYHDVFKFMMGGPGFDWPKVQHIKDFAAFVILAEGRELP